jgi:hypothetical protein
MTYDLHRLRARGLITRIPHTHRNKITDHGLHAAMYLSAVHDRFLPTGPPRLTDQIASPPLRQPPTHTRPRSTTSPAQQVSPHDTINPTPAHQT